MQWLRHRKLLLRRLWRLSCAHRRSVASTSASVSEVPQLPSWSLEEFQNRAFAPARPYRLPFEADKLPAASSKWFVHDSNASFELAEAVPKASELRTAFWSDHKDTLVPLELTSKGMRNSNAAATATFHCSEAPLKLLLTHLGNAQSPTSPALQQERSIYLAQCSLSNLPESLQADIPTPPLVLQTGKGDVYESSLWLGRPPTYTPLHRDPNPNFFLQLAGRKAIRLFPPEVGDAIFEHVQEQLRMSTIGIPSGGISASFRGEEMMAGPERELLHRTVWENDAGNNTTFIEKYGQQAEIGLGEALFIPKGWWHSVKGIGNGITASINWWFR